MNLISAEIIADSLNQHQERITTFKLVFPRYILAELNTHRVFTKNSSSSRAIPFKKMVQQVLDKPFIPIAFQKDHKGMQGTKYLDSTKLYKRGTFSHILRNIFKYSDDDIASEDYTYLDELVEEVAATGSKKAREEKSFSSIEDIKKRTSISNTVIDLLKQYNAFGDLSESAQYTLF